MSKQEKSKVIVDIPNHYSSSDENGVDLIEFWYQHMTKEEFNGAMKSNIMKYATRLGRKDSDILKDLAKIQQYTQRFIDYEEKRRK